MDSGWTSDLLDPAGLFAGLFAVLPTRVDAFDRDVIGMPSTTDAERDNMAITVDTLPGANRDDLRPPPAKRPRYAAAVVPQDGSAAEPPLLSRILAA